MIRLIILTLLIGYACHARIGETKAECEKRYGKVFKSTSDQEIYKFKTFFISIRFLNGICQEILYSKHKGVTLEVVKLSDDEINILLKANSDEKWESDLPAINPAWTTSKLYASTTGNNNAYLYIATWKLLNKSIADKENKTKKELDGL